MYGADEKGPMIAQTVSHYRIIEKLGGGKGVVYKAEDLTLKRLVALKFLPPELTRDADAKQHFIAEARAASSIDHPNICTIHEIDETPEGQMFIAMSHYGGEILKSRLTRTGTTMGTIAYMSPELARAEERDGGVNRMKRRQVA